MLGCLLIPLGLRVSATLRVTIALASEAFALLWRSRSVVVAVTVGSATVVLPELTLAKLLLLLPAFRDPVVQLIATTISAIVLLVVLSLACLPLIPLFILHVVRYCLN